MNILRIAEALHFARPFYFKSLDSSADPYRTKNRSGQSEFAPASSEVLVGTNLQVIGEVSFCIPKMLAVWEEDGVFQQPLLVTTTEPDARRTPERTGSRAFLRLGNSVRE